MKAIENYGKTIIKVIITFLREIVMRTKGKLSDDIKCSGMSCVERLRHAGGAMS